MKPEKYFCYLKCCAEQTLLCLGKKKKKFYNPRKAQKKKIKTKKTEKNRSKWGRSKKFHIKSASVDDFKYNKLTL